MYHLYKTHTDCLLNYILTPYEHYFLNKVVHLGQSVAQFTQPWKVFQCQLPVGLETWVSLRHCPFLRFNQGLAKTLEHLCLRRLCPSFLPLSFLLQFWEYCVLSLVFMLVNFSRWKIIYWLFNLKILNCGSGCKYLRVLIDHLKLSWTSSCVFCSFSL